ncbi:Hachiman antiphage defense system protein HamA [Paraburkholderia pallida]|uniref:DUF1837 domain-containing protein n=1 Tax=Paraburkholderia pallida TaxID=2547399 RepID=A0A4V1B0S2_9BURK|nr:Hachiman antiphage defense system protein HamA [Paraburkholderia pallida]QBR03763.1 DUF1837 domain-containing protein [Paraburkholderia pallida]
MAKFIEWCNAHEARVGSHALRVLSADPARINVGVQNAAAIVPMHYASEERLARILERLGKPEAAGFIQNLLPTTKSIRSGDLGEILATEFIAEQTNYLIPIKRLRWKDHRNMAMRGDDVIGISENRNGQVEFLKVEVKSRIALNAGVLSEARTALDKDGGLPSAHALSFISSRLAEMGSARLADLIDDAQLKHGISAHSVRHLMFTFSANAPNVLLTASLNGYAGPIGQWGAGIVVREHAAFVAGVYNQVIFNANNR